MRVAVTRVGDFFREEQLTLFNIEELLAMGLIKTALCNGWSTPTVSTETHVCIVVSDVDVVTRGAEAFEITSTGHLSGEVMYL